MGLEAVSLASWRVDSSADRDPRKSRPSLGRSELDTSSLPHLPYSEWLQRKMRGRGGWRRPLKAVDPEGNGELLSSFPTFMNKEGHSS